jgi:hypothetical protein
VEEFKPQFFIFAENATKTRIQNLHLNFSFPICVPSIDEIYINLSLVHYFKFVLLLQGSVPNKTLWLAVGVEEKLLFSLQLPDTVFLLHLLLKGIISLQAPFPHRR